MHRVRDSVAAGAQQLCGCALGGRAGARLAGMLACAVSRSTLIRLIRAASDPDCPVPAVLGVDDFALRRGHVYLQATPGHNQLASVQLDGLLSDTRRHAAMVRRCLLSSWSFVRILLVAAFSTIRASSCLAEVAS
jgi:hypothetical protein